MGRSKTYWILVILGALGAVAGILMMRSGKSSLYFPGEVVGWTGISILLIGRIFFARRRQPEPPRFKADKG